MPRAEHKYACSVCGQIVGRSNLVVKRATFMEVGKGGRLIRTRTVAWLCRKQCLEADPDWTQPAYAGSPGMADTEPGREYRDQG